MTTTNHHRTNNQLAEDGKLPAEGGIHGRVPETEADVRAKLFRAPRGCHGLGSYRTGDLTGIIIIIIIFPQAIAAIGCMEPPS
jgi:hypothetical protein